MTAPTAVRDVREQPDLPGSLDRACQLRLMATAGAGDPGRADLALVADRPPERPHVLVVDDVDLLAAVRARLAPPTGGAWLAAPRSPFACTSASLLGHCRFRPLGRGQNGMSSSELPAAGAGSKPLVPPAWPPRGDSAPSFSAPTREPRNCT